MAVKVNQIEIQDHEIYQEMQYHPARSSEEAMEEAAKALVIRELLLQKAKALEIQCDPEQIPQEEALIDALLEKVIQIPEPDEAVVSRFYQNNHQRFKKVNGAPPALADVKTAISDYLVETSWTNAVRDFIQTLVQDSTLSGVTFKDRNAT
ncbi:MAG: hypothetical protein NTW94_08035 [Legionellales bacterium]|nr:hypothetical protein [Legionellales bacterium]